MKAKIKQWLRKWLDEDNDFSPKFRRELKACSFESKDPVGNGKYHTYLFHCMDWDNSEGYFITIDWNYESNHTEKTMSLSRNEIDGILACLNHMKYFDE